MSSSRIFTVVVLALLAGTPIARAASPGQSCAGPSTVSALNQYCENIPGATGGRTPTVGAPALEGQLPSRVVRALRGPSARRRLLALPAAVRLLPRGNSSATDVVGLSLPLLIAMLAVAIAFGAAAARRSRHPRPI